jgi:hypothetical protein
LSLTEDVALNILLQNNTPLDEFIGFTASEIHYLLYDTFGDKSPVQFCDNIDDKTLDQIPIFRVVEEYLKIIQREKYIKLTPHGALPKKVIVELYAKNFLLDEFIENGTYKLSKEQDVIAISSARLAVELARLVKKSNGKITLTKKATKLLEKNNRLEIFKQFFQAFTNKFNWGYNDGYPEQPIGQLGWAFSVILLDKFGDKPRSVEFYAQKYLFAFPNFIAFFDSNYSNAEKHFFSCYGIRSFNRFFVWFGFLTADKKNLLSSTEQDKYTRTDILKSVFKIDY